MKSVLISIQPKWCELIASGKKTVEVRKTRPKTNLPFKVYIYCTKDEPLYESGEKFYIPAANDFGNGKVVGEFVCDCIEEIGFSPYNHGEYVCIEDSFIQQSCLPFDKMFAYLGEEYGYGWHISDLKIYDKPKELGKFRYYNVSVKIENGVVLPTHKIKRPPQSWCYVEGVTE